MEQYKEFTDRLVDYSKKIGIDFIGFADPKFFDRFPKENQPSAYLKETKTVIVIGMYIYDIMLDIWSYPTGKSLQFADSVLKNYCNSIRKFLIEHGSLAKVIPYHPGLFLKDSAALAGLGSIGKNNLLITEKYGSQVRLRALVTSAPLELGNPIFENLYCEDCNLCIDSCPAKAFPNGKFNKKKCNDYNRANWRILSDYSRLWCNKCIESCPIGKSNK